MQCIDRMDTSSRAFDRATQGSNAFINGSIGELARVSVDTQESPVADDFYPQVATANNGLLFISEVLPLISNSDRCVPGGIREQTERAFENLRVLLNDFNSDLNHLVSIQILIPDRESLTIVNEVYRREFMGHKPARSIIPCGSVHSGALIEINAVAMVSAERVSMKWYEESTQYLLSA